MKKTVLTLTICLLAVSALALGSKEKCCIAKTTDFARLATYKIMTLGEFKNLQRQILTEKKYFKKALKQAELAWKADESKTGKRFPKGDIKERKVSMSGKPYATRSAAVKKLYKYQDKEMNKQRDVAAANKRAWRKIAKKLGLGKKEKCEQQIEFEEEEAIAKEAREVFTKVLFAMMQASSK